MIASNADPAAITLVDACLRREFTVSTEMAGNYAASIPILNESLELHLLHPRNLHPAAQKFHPQSATAGVHPAGSASPLETPSPATGLPRQRYNLRRQEIGVLEDPN